ncbi:FliI/YscN family ATPase [Kaustia mangrovi]|uniref:FliI/YscN family ATPase n=2 Tax=Kaustia mangrovi TaxID=2593653 RepID=A0A7S8HDY5_9HYPH|nr:FliI/YscN family ATPase [Kaustia mangrovi]
MQDRLAAIVPRLREGLQEAPTRGGRGRVRRILGVVVHASVEEVRVGEICHLVDPRTGRRLPGEVVGITDEAAILVPLGDLAGLSSLTEVIPTGRDLQVPVGEGLLGRVISALGDPLDAVPWPPEGIDGSYPVNAYPPPPLARALISDPVQLGIRALDGLVTCARGQRIGIFGEPGAGKSSLLADIVRGTDADVAVVALVGERGREVREFVERQLGEDGRARAVVVAATSDRPAIERVKAAYVATTIAEYFRDRGRNVLLLMDSITRFARAQREIGLASGEPPTRRGFPPSLFAALPRLLERSGPGETGSITGIYTVLTEGDGTLDPVAEEVQAILDGHVVLSSELARRDHFPAIDVLRSRSRLMDTVAPESHRADAGRIRELMARHADIELLVRVGEYEKGSDPLADEAVAKIDRINAFLRQAAGESEAMESTRAMMRELAE